MKPNCEEDYFSFPKEILMEFPPPDILSLPLSLSLSQPIRYYLTSYESNKNQDPENSGKTKVNRRLQKSQHLNQLFDYMSPLLLEKSMAPHSSTLAWKIPWMEEPGGLQSMGSLRAGHD